MRAARTVKCLEMTVWLVLSGTQPLWAINVYWAGTDAVEYWADGSNWTDGSAPGIGDVAKFTAIAYTGIVNVTNDTEVVDFAVYTSPGVVDLTLDITAGKTLTSGRGNSQALELHAASDITVMNGTLELLSKVYLQPAPGRGLTIKNNGIVTCNNELFLGGYAAADQNRITLQSGGQLLMTNGAALLHVGSRRTSDPFGNRLLIDGENSRCLAKALNVSEASGCDNVLIVTNGGQLHVTAANLNIGFTRGWVTTDSADRNSVTVTGPDSTAFQLAGYTYVGYNGNNNRLTVENSGYYQADYLRVGSATYPTKTNNTLTVKSGASLVSLHSITVYSNSVLALDGGSITSSLPVEIKPTALLKGRGTIKGSVTLDGILTAGAPTGTLTLAQGDLTFGPAATANFTFASPVFEAGSYSLVQGTAATGEEVTFDGTLNLAFNRCRWRTTLKIFAFDSYAGSFDQVNVAGVASSTRVTFNPADGTVTLDPGGTLVLVR